jgi:hypothetical protein
LTNAHYSFSFCSVFHARAPDSADAARTDALPDREQWARATLAGQIERLGRLAEAGLGIATALEQRAAGEAAQAIGAQPQVAPQDAPRGDLGLTYARVARAVRLTIALQSKLLNEVRAHDETEARERAAGADDQAAEAAAQADAADRALRGRDKARLDRVERIVQRAINAEYDEDEDEDVIEKLSREAADRLDDEDIYGDLTRLTNGEIVERICRDLGLSPDWSRWAEEAWAIEEASRGEPGSPFVALAARHRTPGPGGARYTPNAPPP